MWLLCRCVGSIRRAAAARCSFVECIDCSLKTCAAQNTLETGRGLHTETIKRGLETDLRVGSAILDMYKECGLLLEAQKVFDGLLLQDTVSWNVLIAGYGDHGLIEDMEKCLSQMFLKGIPPDCATYVCGLRGCATAQSSETSGNFHSEIIKRGLEGELYLGTTLVDTYMACDSVAEACHVFNALPVRNTVSWNVLIVGYVSCGMAEEASICYGRMLKEGILPDFITFVSSLRACGIMQAIEIGQGIHSEATKRGFESECSVGNMLVDMYTECELLDEARRVFNGLPMQNTVSWNALIAGYMEHGFIEEAKKCFYQMLLEDVFPDCGTIIASLKTCGSMGDLQSGQKLHAGSVKRGLEKELHAGSALLDMYKQCGSLQEAQQLFDSLPVRNAVVWNVLIAGYADCELAEEVMKCFQKMQLEDVSPDPATFVCGLKACASLQSLDMGHGMHTESIKRGIETVPTVGNVLVNMYIECCSMLEACEVFNRLPARNSVSWNALISGYAEQGLSNEVEHALSKMMMEGISPNSVTFTCSLKVVGTSEIGQEMHAEICKRGLEGDLYLACTLADMYIESGSLAEAAQVLEMLPSRSTVSWTACIRGSTKEVGTCFRQMLLDGIPPDSVVFVCGLKVCATEHALDAGREIHIEAVKRGWERKLRIGSTLVDMYTECRLIAEACQVFHGLPVRDAASWNVLIAGYMEQGLSEEATNSFRQMISEGLSPDRVSFVCSLQACGCTGMLESGWEIHMEILKRGLENELSVGSTLLDMYGNCGSLAEARRVFDKLPDRGVESWTTIIKAYGKNHEGSIAVQCFEDMLDQGVKPSPITFACILAACSHSSLVIKGQEYFELMRKHAIKRTLDHYVCMVDLFARSGQFCEAERFIAAMQSSPCPLILCALLSACKIYGKLELGEKCFQQLVQENQEDSAAYLLMANIYATAGRWADANLLEEMRKDTGAKKRPGSALTQLDSELYEFAVGANKQYEDKLGRFDLLFLRLKDEGHVPNLDLVSKHIFKKEKEVKVLESCFN